MNRREAIAMFGGAAFAWPLVARAQQAGRTYSISVLTSFPYVPNGPDPIIDEFKRSGFVEGRNLLVDRHGMGVDVTQLEAVAAELVKTSPDAIMVWGPAAGRAAQHATRSIPIVLEADDPVESRLVASMSQPGGNTTGIGIFAAQLDAKRLEILHELVPTARRIGVLVDPTQEVGLARVEGVAQDLHLELIVREARSPTDIVGAIDALAAAQVAAINVLASVTFYAGRTLIINRTHELGLPTIYWWAELAREGGLVGFGPRLEEVNRLLVQQVVQVLKGARPADLPIVQPTKFELVINLKTARALGLEMPTSILAQADEVIE